MLTNDIVSFEQPGPDVQKLNGKGYPEPNGLSGAKGKSRLTVSWAQLMKR